MRKIDLSKRINVVSTFDGPSCGMQALMDIGAEVNNYFASEIDPYSMAISKKNFPNIKQVGDVRDLRGYDLPKVDLLLGGSPCQGFSFSGKGLNFEDPRSKLFFEFVRIKEETNPTHFLLENTPMLKIHRDVISDYLGVEPVMINSSKFSRQVRKRWYWTNIPIAELPTKDMTGGVIDIAEPYVDAKYFVTPKRDVILLEPKKGRRKIGYIGKDSQAHRIYDINEKSVTLCALGGGLGAKTGLYAGSAENLNDVFTFTRKDHLGRVIDSFIRRLTPLECERLQTLPDNFTKGVTDSQRYKMLGNGWTVAVISHILRGIL